jgi:thiosulfate dehydrogenase (quinone) large subunit
MTTRSVVYALAAIAAISLAWLLIPQVAPEPNTILRTIVTIVFWASFVGLVIALFQMRHAPGARDVETEGPGFARFLFNNSAAGLFWLPIRLFVGLAWLQSGLGKLNDPGWTQGGESLRAYWERAAAIPEAPARPPITYEWYRDFLNMLLNANAETWFSWLIMLGEVAVGVALIIGMLTGIAAFFGAFMNMSFLLAGSASTNPILFTASIGLILAWKVAGYYGVDRWLLPRLGTPWQPGKIFGARAAEDRVT